MVPLAPRGLGTGGSAIHGAGTVEVAMLHRVAEEWKSKAEVALTPLSSL